MSGRKLPKNIDLASNIDVASGFFSDSVLVKKGSTNTEKITAPQDKEKKSSTATTTIKKKNLGGRPKKEGLKSAQFTVTMHPEMYEKIRIIANEHTSGNISRLIDASINSFCNEHHIDLSTIQIDSKKLDMYKKKQENKGKKK